MSWQALTAPDVLSEFNVSESANIVAASSSADNLDAIVSRVTEEVRGCCIAGGNRVGPAGTIPGQLLEDAIALARWRLLISLPNLPQYQTEHRKAAYTEARAMLKDIAKGDVLVEVPTEGTAADLDSPVGGIEISDNVETRYFTRSSLDGL